MLTFASGSWNRLWKARVRVVKLLDRHRVLRLGINGLTVEHKRIARLVAVVGNDQTGAHVDDADNFAGRGGPQPQDQLQRHHPPVQQMRGNDSPRPSSSRRCSPRLVSSSTASPRTLPMLAAEGWKRCSTAKA